ncbi:Histidine kinase-, DNA gyrase B-, and HSP90-like ATPase [Arachidicoccus rhizosphaerae]|uniref:histidine kinase n=1 Tax=Arachidicoccus rhizosphaerae TaxID=551991 RepID=A0A1H4A585_9BACT|nr:sensor histidine kinase [Arachidicoccus rhizosphaerae]SEA30732.1 Histidine kinase-, DNA gyrase B-, and HSP90-like ATPase [Arachidicoccus rhizosphaerae]
MKYLTPLFSLLVIFLFKASAQVIDLDQKGYEDSLSAKLGQPLSDSERAVVNFYLSNYWSEKDTLKSKNYLQAGRKLMGSNRFLSALYQFYRAGLIFDKDIQLSQSLYLRTDSLLAGYTTTEAYTFRSRLWSNIAVLKQYQDDKQGYMDLQLNKSLPYAKLSKNPLQLALVYSNIGLMFNNLDEFKKAQHYDSLALTALQDVKRKANINSVGILRNVIRNRLFQGDLPGAKQILNSLYKVVAPYPDNINFLDYYELAGAYYCDIKDYDTAIHLLDKGIRLADKLGQGFLKISIQFQKYRVYAFQKDYKKALALLLEILKFTDVSLAGNRVILFKEIANTYEKLGDYKNGMIWLRKMAELSDSLSEANVTNNINELEAKYQSSEKEKKIFALKSQQSKAALIQEKQQAANRLLLLGCLFLLAVVGGAVFYYRKLTGQKEINHAQKLKEIEQLHELGVAQAMLEAEERERNRVARELHDGLGGMLAGVKLNLSVMEMGNEGLESKNENQVHMEENMEQTLNKVIGQLDSSISELRRIARNMMPESLLRLGLEKALKDLCDYYCSPKCQVHFQGMDIAKDMPIVNQVYIYRIIQELVSNAVRHGAAKSIFVQCSQNNELFLITVEDDGKGFDTGILAQQKGLGWHNIQTRVAFLKGKLDIHSEMGQGTTVNIELNGYTG